MKVKSISSILEEAANEQLPVKVGEYLKKFEDNFTLKMLLQWAFDPRVVWNLPVGAPPYEPNKEKNQENILYVEAKRLYVFLQGQSTMPRMKLEFLFKEILESVDPQDAVLLLAVKDKTLPYPEVTPGVVNYAFPGLIAIPDDQVLRLDDVVVEAVTTQKKRGSKPGVVFGEEHKRNMTKYGRETKNKREKRKAATLQKAVAKEETS